MLNTKDVWKRFDFLLFAAVLILCIFGVALISSAIAGNPTLANHAQRQAIFLVIGIVVLFIAAAIDYHIWLSLTRPFYIVTALLLILVFVMGEARFGAARWLQIGTETIQPAELAKIVAIMALAQFFSSHITKINSWRTVFQSLLLAGGIAIWIFLQPDLKTTIVIAVLWFAMLWISGWKTKNVLIFIGVLLVLLVIFAALDFPFLADYQRDRITNFLHPQTEARYGDTYNVDQALISIGSGGWFGQGYGQGSQVQLRFLKIRHNDFIFSVLANEFGFVGTVVVLLLLIFVVYRCFAIAAKAPDAYGALLAYGFGVLMAFQTLVNVGVNLRLLPVTGLTLPFISYGGSSLVSLLLGIGLVENINMRTDKKLPID